MPKGRCFGARLARRATCLSDILLDAPPAWGEAALLRRRGKEGWRTYTRIAVSHAVLRCAAWLQSLGVKKGDRVGLLGHNGLEWFVADFAILRIGAVTVPAYWTEPAEAVRYVLQDAGCKLVLVEPGEQEEKLKGIKIPVYRLRSEEGVSLAGVIQDERWDDNLRCEKPDRKDLATLIYTSGTTGRPKGVMLTHDNILSDVEACLGTAYVGTNDVFLSILPVSHAFERTVGHFLPTCCGSQIAYAESLHTLMRDFVEVKPTIVISVPRLYEKIRAGVHERLQRASPIKRFLFARAQKAGAARFWLNQQGKPLPLLARFEWEVLDRLVHRRLRESLGGRLRFFVSGGAALNPQVAMFLLSAGILVLPGYGLTEASPVLSVNRAEKIKPDTVGPPLPGVEVKLAEDGELLARGPMIMQGYWNLPEETAEAIDAEGWLHTGDLAEIDEEGFIRIVDRKKEIIVLSNGENVPPAIVEHHLVQDPCVSQAMVVGEDRPHLAALIVPNEAALALAYKRSTRMPLPTDWRENPKVHDWMLRRLAKACQDLPHYMEVRDFRFVDEAWTQEDGMLTPTLKLKRRRLHQRYADLIEAIYASKNG